MHTSVGVCFVYRSLVVVVPVVCLPSGSIVGSFAGSFGRTSGGMCFACIFPEVFVLVALLCLLVVFDSTVCLLFGLYFFAAFG